MTCPIESCQGRAATQTAMQVHFLHRHIRNTMIIMEEGNLPQPRRPWCNILVPWKAMSGKHTTTAQCVKGEEQKRRWLSE